MKAAQETPLSPWTGFEASARVEGDENGCHKQGREGALRSAKSCEPGQEWLICVQGRHRQLKRILRHFGARAGFASERQPLSCYFPPFHLLQTLRSVDNVVLLRGIAEVGGEGGIWDSQDFPSREVPKPEGTVWDWTSACLPEGPSHSQHPAEPLTATLPSSQFRAG